MTGARSILVGPDGDEIDVAEANEVLDQHGLKMRIGRRFAPGAFRVDAKPCFDPFESDETFVLLYRVDPSGKEYVEEEEACAPRDQIKVMSEMLERVRSGRHDLPRRVVRVACEEKR